MTQPTFTAGSVDITITVNVHGADPMPRLGSAALFQPTQARIAFNSGEFRSLQLSGPSVVSEGRLATRHSETWWLLDGLPEWAVLLISDAQQITTDRSEPWAPTA